MVHTLKFNSFMGTPFTPPNCQFWLTSDFRVTFLFFGTYKETSRHARRFFARAREKRRKVQVTWPLKVRREDWRRNVWVKRRPKNGSKIPSKKTKCLGQMPHGRRLQKGISWNYSRQSKIPWISLTLSAFNQAKIYLFIKKFPTCSTPSC